MIFAGSSVSRTIELELLPISPSIHLSLLSERLFISCLSVITLLYKFLQSSYPKYIENPDIECTKLVEVKSDGIAA